MDKATQHITRTHLKNVILSEAKDLLLPQDKLREGPLLPEIRDSHLHLRAVQLSIAHLPWRVVPGANAPSE
jgi:hypothetical protein